MCAHLDRSRLVTSTPNEVETLIESGLKSFGDILEKFVNSE